MFMQLIGSLQLGLLYTAMALGVYIAFRVLNTPDLTIDGSFTFGMAVCGMVTVAGHPVLAVLAGVLAGGLAGLVTGFLQTKLLIHPILAGILTMTGLYTVNLFVLGGRSNVSLVGKDTVFTLFNKLSPLQAEYNKFILALLLMVLLIALLAVFFKTRPGISIRATGDNEEMVRSSSINADAARCMGLVIGNACVACSGALICQYQMSADVGYGSGMLVIGLASVIIGEAFFGRRSLDRGLIAACVGSIAYRVMIAFALKFDVFPAYALKLVSAVIVAVALAVPLLKTAVRNAVQSFKRRKRV